MAVPHDASRRRFVQGLASSGLVAGSGLWLPAWSAVKSRLQTLTGTEFDLAIGEQPVNFTGSPRMATTVNQSLPAPTLR